MDSSNNGNHRKGALEREIERYREACVSALDQLEWIVGYLYKIHKPQIARTLDRNRSRSSKRFGSADSTRRSAGGLCNGQSETPLR